MNNIDPNAVCISYTMKEKDEALVTAFRNMLKEAGIPYKCSQEPIDNTVSEFEDIIGRGTIVVIFYSPDYFKSPHCMNEYALARKNEVHNNIFTVRCYKFVYNDIFRDLVRFWSAEEGDFRLITTNHTKVQEASKSHDFYLQPTHPYSIHNLSSFFPDNPYYTEKNLDVLFEKVKEKYYELSGKSTGSNKSANCLNPLPSALLDDIDFNQINFQYNQPIAKNGDEKVFFGRKEFVENLHKRFNNNENCLNVVATGGMGKTSVAHIYIREYRTEYNKIEFLVSNNNICADCVRKFRDYITSLCPDYEQLLCRNDSTQEQAIKQIDRVLSRASKKCLLVVDVNVTDENNDYLVAPDFSDKMKANWHILYLSRQRIAKTKSIQLSNFEDDLDGAKGLFNSIYPNDWEDYKLKDLFKLVYYHPLLIEHLAAYGIRGQNKKTYQQLCDVVSENRIKNATINKSYSEFSTCFIDKEKTKDVCVYLSQLFDINDYDKDEQYVLQHFVLWPYDYISIDTVNLLLKTDEIQDWEGTLIGLTDKVVFSQSSKGYRMHGLLGDTLKSEQRNFDYCNYISNVKTLLSSDDEIDSDSDTYKCIDNTPLEIFGIGSSTDYSVYENWGFLRGLAKLKVYDVNLSELSYKAYLLKELYNKSGEEIYHKVYGEYRNVSSHLIYNEWLYTKSNYNNDLPNTESDVYGTFIVIPVNGASFKMRKVKHVSFPMCSNDYSSEQPVHQVTLTNDYYIGEVQVTQQLWMAVMGENNNPSRFNEGENTKNYPVECVSWYDCMDFIIKLNERMKYKDYRFRLPTEAEWEYAARSGGKSHKYSWNTETQNDGAKNVEKRLKEFAWFDKNSGRRTHPVATDVLPNELGIYDMSGNVWEWCQDWFANYSSNQVTNPQGLINGSPNRVLRGGSWFRNAQDCRVSSRFRNYPVFRSSNFGFRLLLSSQNK